VSGLPFLGLSEGLTIHSKNTACYEMLRASNLAGSCLHDNEPSGFIKGGGIS
jgi:hypothetical protein